RLEDETLRLHEYSPGKSTAAFAFDPERFAAHEKFFVEDVRRWAQSRFGLALPVDRTAVFGVSASGELALAMGLRYPDIYGVGFWHTSIAVTEEPFELAADAVIEGRLTDLHRLLRDRPALATARSHRQHHANLLHYVAANGVEQYRQKSPSNAVEIATTLLEA